MGDGRKAAAEEAKAIEFARAVAKFRAQDPGAVWHALEGVKDSLERLCQSDPALRRAEHCALESARRHLSRAMGEG